MTVIFAATGSDRFGFVIADDLKGAGTKGGKTRKADKVTALYGRWVLGSFGSDTPGETADLLRQFDGVEMNTGRARKCPEKVEDLIVEMRPSLNLFLNVRQRAVDKTPEADMEKIYKQTGNFVVLDTKKGELRHVHFGPLFPHPQPERCEVSDPLPRHRVFRFSAGPDDGNRYWDHCELTKTIEEDPWTWCRRAIAEVVSQVPAGTVGALGAGAVTRNGRSILRSSFGSPFECLREAYAQD